MFDDSGRGARAIAMAPSPPADFVQRSTELLLLKQKFIDAKGGAIPRRTALLGAGGYGKTTLAKALANDKDIQDAYPDGILWVELGQAPRSVLSILSDLVEILTGVRPGVESVAAASVMLSEALGDRRILLIIDDVWREQDLRPFLEGGPKTSRLIATRIDFVLPADAIRQLIGAMQSDEALELLGWGLPGAEVTAQHPSLVKLAERLGKWPQLLRMVNGFLRDRVVRGHQPLARAVVGVNKRLDEKGLVAFDEGNEADRTNAVARVIGVSLDLLDKSGRRSFSELAAFPEDVDVPIGVVERLWARTGGIDELKTEDLLTRLHGLSLLLDLDLCRRTLRLHDTIRHFLQHEMGKDKLIMAHRQLLLALDDKTGSAEVDPLTRRYYYLHLPYHLAEAGERAKLDTLLLDPGWLKAKLAAIGNPHSIIADYELQSTGKLQNIVGRTLRLIAGICARDPRQLMPQLLGRLISYDTKATAGFILGARRHLSPPALLPLWPSLASPGTETARLEGHTDSVTALCMLPDGRLASGSDDTKIRLWDIKTAVENACVEGHSNLVWALCSLADGRLASGSADTTIRWWDVKKGGESGRLEGHTDSVRALCLLPDERLASGSSDNTIRLWDVKSYAEITRFEGHTQWVTALCMLPDGRLASGSWDNTIRLWDTKTGAETKRLVGAQSDWFRALCVLPDGRLASASWDNSIQLWDLSIGVVTDRLEGHADWVTALCWLGDGRLASGSWDNTIRLWDLKSGAETVRIGAHARSVDALWILPDNRLASGSDDATIRLWDLDEIVDTTEHKAHSRSVAALCVLRDGAVATGSWDYTARLWDLRTGTETLRFEGHEHWVTALCVLPDGRLASGSEDATVRLWDVTTGASIASLEGHSHRIATLCVLPEGRFASGSWDQTIRIWDTKRGIEIARIDKHTDRVNALCLLSDRYLASGSCDNMIRVWDLNTGSEATRLEGHTDWVTALCLLPDGRLASGSRDKTIRLWDLKAGSETARLERHKDRVTALCVLPDGRLASGSWNNTVRLWDIEIADEIARLEVDSRVLCLGAFSPARLIVGDDLGGLHLLDVVD
jgi:WD40 repeat protein